MVEKQGTLGFPCPSDTIELRLDHLEHTRNQSVERQKDIHNWKETASQDQGVWKWYGEEKMAEPWRGGSHFCGDKRETNNER